MVPIGGGAAARRGRRGAGAAGTRAGRGPARVAPPARAGAAEAGDGGLVPLPGEGGAWLGAGPGAAELGPADRAAVAKYGLTADQMATLGLTDAAAAAAAAAGLAGSGAERADLHAKAAYRADLGLGEVRAAGGTREAPTMAYGRGYDRMSNPPPDLPSMLYAERIIYIGMPLVPQVTELLIAQLMYFNFDEPDKEVTLYINCLGAQSQKQQIAFETEALAVLDTMNFIGPTIKTINLHQCLGNATLLLAGGEKGKRLSFPNGVISTAPPRLNRGFGTAVEMQIRGKEMDYIAEQQVQLLAGFTGQPLETVREDYKRDKTYSPEAAKEYGLIDDILSPRQMTLTPAFRKMVFEMFQEDPKRDEYIAAAEAKRAAEEAAAEPEMAETA